MFLSQRFLFFAHSSSNEAFSQLLLISSGFLVSAEWSWELSKSWRDCGKEALEGWELEGCSLRPSEPVLLARGSPASP